MRRIGLLNVQHIDNYGANLIAFAMERETAEILGPEAQIVTVDFRPDQQLAWDQAKYLTSRVAQFGLPGAVQYLAELRRKYCSVTGLKIIAQKNPALRAVKNTGKRLLGRPVVPPVQLQDPDQAQREVNFETFRQKWLHRTAPVKARQLDDLGLDTIVVGSDVVWKPQRLLAPEEGEAYFLTRAPKVRAVAYAASIGVSDQAQLKRLEKRYAAAVGRFDAISLRESSAADYIRRLLPDRQVYNCIDPVFLREGAEYAALCDAAAPEQPYIYAYILGTNPEALRFVRQLAEKTGCRIVYHTGGKDFPEGVSSRTDGPGEFLNHVYHADFVVTDSFHGTAFAIIFQKRFLTFTRGKLSIRLENFLAAADLQDRLVDSAEAAPDITVPVDWQRAQQKLGPWIRESKEFLREALLGGERQEG